MKSATLVFTGILILSSVIAFSCKRIDYTRVLLKKDCFSILEEDIIRMNDCDQPDDCCKTLLSFREGKSIPSFDYCFELMPHLSNLDNPILKDWRKEIRYNFYNRISCSMDSLISMSRYSKTRLTKKFSPKLKKRNSNCVDSNVVFIDTYKITINKYDDVFLTRIYLMLCKNCIIPKNYEHVFIYTENKMIDHSRVEYFE